MLTLHEHEVGGQDAIIIFLAVPFSAVGAIWFLYLLGYNMSIAVWVGLIALMGVDAETGMFMLLYLDLAYHEARRKGLMRAWADLKEAILHGAVKRLRPKVMTVGVMFMGLVPIMWSTGSGADVMKRIAAPDDRRDIHLVHSGAGSLPRDLRDLEVACGSQTNLRLSGGHVNESLGSIVPAFQASIPTRDFSRPHGRAYSLPPLRGSAFHCLRTERLFQLQRTRIEAREGRQ